MVHILPGEDDPDQLQIIKYHLNQFGLSVVLASTGEMVLGLLATDQYDGVVSYYELPEMNGSNSSTEFVTIRFRSDSSSSPGGGERIWRSVITPSKIMLISAIVVASLCRR
jgi:CheY-like chemotaxis protein